MAKRRNKKKGKAVKLKVSKKIEKIPKATKRIIKTPEKKPANKVLISALIVLAIALIILIALFVKYQSNNSAVGNNTPGSNSDLNTKEAILAKCLTEKGVIFYGASWCPHCANQKAAFGDAEILLPYVECTDVALQQECADAGVTSIPDWRINGQQYLGTRSLADLAKYSGCVY